MLVAATASAFLAISLFAYAAALGANNRLAARAIRTRLADYDGPVPSRETELSAPLVGRLVRPLWNLLASIAQRLFPATYVERQREKLTIAGMSQPEDLDRFLVMRILSLVVVPLLWFLVMKIAPLHGIELFGLLGLIAMAGVLAPDAWLNRAVASRQEAIRRRLPDILDLLTISVEAGLGFEQALARTVMLVPGPLSDEFGRLLGEMRAGASRSDALMALDARVKVEELRSFVLAIQQADTFGISVGSLLRSQAAEMRVRRQQRIQEQAQKAPVKMLFPMVFCIMPALFVVIAGPAVMSIYHAFHSIH
jgi:tight adherence protein C